MTDITLVAVEPEVKNHKTARWALDRTIETLKPREVLVFASENFYPGATFTEIESFPSVTDFSRWMLKNLHGQVKTSHMIYQQWDAMVARPDLWTDDFLKYDYIGAPWYWHPEGYQVGNGGFSLRSARLLEALQDTLIQIDPDDEYLHNEDNCICIGYRDYLEKLHNITYAPLDVAKQFSYELGPFVESYGFHGPWNVIRLMDQSTIDFFMENMPLEGRNIYWYHHVLEALAHRNQDAWLQKLIDVIKATQPDLIGPLNGWFNNEGQILIGLALTKA